jgi:hypothetical protein
MRNFVARMSINLYTLRASATSARASTAVRFCSAVDSLVVSALKGSWNPEDPNPDSDPLHLRYRTGQFCACLSPVSGLLSQPGVFVAGIAHRSLATIQPMSEVVPEFFVECLTDQYSTIARAIVAYSSGVGLVAGLYRAVRSARRYIPEPSLLEQIGSFVDPCQSVLAARATTILVVRRWKVLLFFQPEHS